MAIAYAPMADLGVGKHLSFRTKCSLGVITNELLSNLTTYCGLPALENVCPRLKLVLDGASGTITLSSDSEQFFAIGKVTRTSKFHHSMTSLSILVKEGWFFAWQGYRTTNSNFWTAGTP